MSQDTEKVEKVYIKTYVFFFSFMNQMIMNYSRSVEGLSFWFTEFRNKYFFIPCLGPNCLEFSPVRTSLNQTLELEKSQ